MNAGLVQRLRCENKQLRALTQAQAKQLNVVYAAYRLLWAKLDAEGPRPRAQFIRRFGPVAYRAALPNRLPRDSLDDRLLLPVPVCRREIEAEQVECYVAALEDWYRTEPPQLYSLTHFCDALRADHLLALRDVAYLVALRYPAGIAKGPVAGSYFVNGLPDRWLCSMTRQVSDCVRQYCIDRFRELHYQANHDNQYCPERADPTAIERSQLLLNLLFVCNYQRLCQCLCEQADKAPAGGGAGLIDQPDAQMDEMHSCWQEDQPDPDYQQSAVAMLYDDITPEQVDELLAGAAEEEDW